MERVTPARQRKTRAAKRERRTPWDRRLSLPAHVRCTRRQRRQAKGEERRPLPFSTLPLTGVSSAAIVAPLGREDDCVGGGAAAGGPGTTSGAPGRGSVRGTPPGPPPPENRLARKPPPPGRASASTAASDEAGRAAEDAPQDAAARADWRAERRAASIMVGGERGLHTQAREGKRGVCSRGAGRR